MARKSTGILKLRDLIPWESFRPLLEELTGYATRDWSKGGKQPFDPVLMFKVLVLPMYHGLSDDATEEQIFDRTSFKNFLGLRIGDDIPDAKTLWDPAVRDSALRRRDARAGASSLKPSARSSKAKISSHAKAASWTPVLWKPRASATAASRTSASKKANALRSSTKTPQCGPAEDSEARWTKKNDEVHYGWKNHVKTDLKTKIIIQAATTAASVHDSQVFEELLDEKDQAVLADSAYHSAEHEECLIKLNAQEFLMRKATRSHPLSEEEQQTNQTISRMRVRVEHVFARMAQMGADLCRSIGLKRATQHNHLCNLVYNMDRYACLTR